MLSKLYAQRSIQKIKKVKSKKISLGVKFFRNCLSILGITPDNLYDQFWKKGSAKKWYIERSKEIPKNRSSLLWVKMKCAMKERRCMILLVGESWYITMIPLKMVPASIIQAVGA